MHLFQLRLLEKNEGYVVNPNYSQSNGYQINVALGALRHVLIGSVSMKLSKCNCSFNLVTSQVTFPSNQVNSGEAYWGLLHVQYNNARMKEEKREFNQSGCR